MATTTHWMEYGEPVDDGRVEATKRVSYHTGPNCGRDDEVVHGTLPMDALQVFEQSDHVHTDGSMMLSAVDDDTREYLEDAFEATE